MKLTGSQEEYLKTIYILEKNIGKIRVTDIAKKLKITKPYKFNISGRRIGKRNNKKT